MFPDADTLIEIASELGVDVSFIEKDWHACQALKAISSIENENFTIIFSGGTSLSKAHGLIQRFSEDLDFRWPLHQKRLSLKDRIKTLFYLRNFSIETTFPSPS